MTTHSIAVIVPAYNEEAGIGDTIEGLLAQELPDGVQVSQIIIVPNNCTDRTAEIARQYPVTVFEMPSNPHRKSGAMNAAWERFCLDEDLIFTMDADTVVMPDTLAKMVKALDKGGRNLAAVCARYWAKDGSGLAWRLQRLEYARYDDARELRGWKVQVASGAAVMYRNIALVVVCKKFRRSGPWDDTSLIEDYALTLDLKTIGYRVSAASGAHVLTDTPATFSELWRQRPGGAAAGSMRSVGGAGHRPPAATSCPTGCSGSRC